LTVALTRRRRTGAAGGSARHVRRAVLATLEAEGAKARDVSILLTDDPEIRGLNRTYRGFDKPTDVLAFGLDEAELPEGLAAALAVGPLGDVVISVETARRQAERRRTSLDQELELLAVHGTLHLLGYDHERPEDARRMRSRTRSIRRHLAPHRPV